MSGWKVPSMWKDSRCVILAGGPSVRKVFGIPDALVASVRDQQSPLSVYNEYLTPIMKEHIIGVNMSYKFGGWVDMVFFGDSGFWKMQGQGLLEFPNLRITTTGSTPPGMRAIKHLEKHKETYGLTDDPTKLCWNLNSGAAAINIAVHTGVKQILLVGFDMKLDNGFQHWHKAYTVAEQMVLHTYQRHLKCFEFIKRDADRMGIEILNVNEDSGINEFQKVKLEQVL